MKKMTVMAILLSLALVACGEKKVEEVKEAATQAVEQVKETTTEAAAEVKESAEKAMADVKEAAENTVSDAKEAATNAVADMKEMAETKVGEMKEAVMEALKFKSEDGTEYSLDVDGDNAILKTSTGEEYTLKRDVSASGERYTDDKGNEIHFKAEDGGMLNLNGKEIKLDIAK